jgi:hypothetical protein
MAKIIEFPRRPPPKCARALLLAHAGESTDRAPWRTQRLAAIVAAFRRTVTRMESALDQGRLADAQIAAGRAVPLLADVLLEGARCASPLGYDWRPTPGERRLCRSAEQLEGEILALVVQK